MKIQTHDDTSSSSPSFAPSLGSELCAQKFWNKHAQDAKERIQVVHRRTGLQV